MISSSRRMMLVCLLIIAIAVPTLFLAPHVAQLAAAPVPATPSSNTPMFALPAGVHVAHVQATTDGTYYTLDGTSQRPFAIEPGLTVYPLPSSPTVIYHATTCLQPPSDLQTRL